MSPLRNAIFAKLFAAQVIALLGTGLLTVALSLLAYDLAGADAGRVLGTALAIKMMAYVTLSPVMTALTARLPRRGVLIAADLTRATAALCLPFVDEVWHIYVLIAVLQAASATFTPVFQATIPAVLTDEKSYTQAISYARVAYALESLASPGVAALLLTVLSYSDLFKGTVIGFVASAALVALCALPRPTERPTGSFIARATRGLTLFSRSQELRALAALNVTVAAAMAMVIVNSVLITGEVFHRPQNDVTILLAAFGVGSLALAAITPRLVGGMPDKTVMLAGGAASTIGLCSGVLALSWPSTPMWWLLLASWAITGGGTSAILTPAARIVRRAAADVDHPAVFAAQFSLSHACFLVTYPVAGYVGSAAGVAWACGVLAVAAAASTACAQVTWRDNVARNDHEKPIESILSKE